MRHKYSPAIMQALGGPSQKDFEYDKKLQDYKEAKSRMVTIKKVIDSFPKKLEGYKQMLDTIVGTCDFVFDKNQKGYCQFMHNITSAHRALSNKLVTLFNQFGQLRNTTNGWIKEINDVSAKCRLREQCKKNYAHYESKLYELNVDRMKEVKKKNKISESDHERFVRNIAKFQKAGKELVYTSNQAYRAIEQFLNIRYDQIVMAMVGFVEAERAFYNEASHIINFFTNIRNNAINLKKTLITTNTKYDAAAYLKGRALLNMSLQEFFSSNYKVLPPPPGVGPNNNQNQGQGQGQGPNQGFGMGQNMNPNSQQNKGGIINPFSADNNDLDDININNNNFGRIKTAPNNGFNNKSTRDTFALNNPYNSQANPYSGQNNNINNNNYNSNNNFNNNFNNPYDNNNMNSGMKPFGGNNNNQDPYGGNNYLDPFDGNNDQDPYGGNNNQDPYDGNNNQDPYGGNNNQTPYGGNNNQNNNNMGEGGNLGNNNQNNNNNNNNNNNDNNNNNNGEDDPFDF